VLHGTVNLSCFKDIPIYTKKLSQQEILNWQCPRHEKKYYFILRLKLIIESLFLLII